ncbi:hypothetical protein TNCV_834001 [Trichonephila clavipes]|nr:hypothetical protein TNCV_834001 [Trichonephila clavipes]
MYKDTKNFVRSCTVCLSRKNAFKIPPAPHQPVGQSQEPGETCHIDIFGPLKTTPEEQEAAHVDLSTRATKQHHYDYKIGSLCFIKTPNIKSNSSPKLRPKFEGPYRRRIITNSNRYDEEIVKDVLFVIVEELTETEKQKAAELEEKQKAVVVDQQREREFELEKMKHQLEIQKLSQAPVTSQQLENPMVALNRIILRFNSKDDEMGLYLTIFERSS